MKVRSQPCVTVELVVEMIQRATDEEEHAWADADREYAKGILNEIFPGLGDFVAPLPHKYDDWGL